MKYWLIKSEPESYSIDDLKKDKSTVWEGIRNYRARNIMRDEMKVGDLILYYHSMADPAGVVGIAKVLELGLPDNSALDKKDYYYDPKVNKDKNPWVAPKFGFVAKFKRMVSLDEIKKQKGLKNMVMFKIPRLSVQPVTQKEFKIIKKMGK